MHGPDGVDYENRIRFLEVESPERIVYAHGDPDGEDFRVYVAFDDFDDTTELTMRMVFPSAEALQQTVKQYGADEGAKQTLERLDAHLPRVMHSRVEANDLVLERIFRAPRELVFEAFSKAEHLKRWWGPEGWPLTHCEIDFRPGGVWHFCMSCTDENQPYFGQESWGKAIYHEIDSPERIVYTDYFSDAEGNINESMPGCTVTLTFIDLGERMRLVSRGRYGTAEALQQVIDMGMLEGVSQTWDQLSGLLEQLQPHEQPSGKEGE